MQQRTTGGAGVGLALVAAAAFATSGSFAASLLDAGWTPGAAVVARLMIGAMLMTIPAVVVLHRRRSVLRGGVQPRGRTSRLAHARTLGVYGVVAVAGGQFAYFNAVQHLSVAIALLLEFSGVLLVVGWLWLKGERPRLLTAAGAVVAVAGLALVLNLTGGSHDVDAVGLVWAAASAVALAVYFVLSAGDDTLPPIVVAWGGLTIGSVTITAAAVAGVLPLAAPRTDVTLLGVEMTWIVPVVGLSLVAAALAYVAGIAAARRLGARLASIVGLTEVLFAMAFAWLLLDQVMTRVQLFGSVLVVGGVALVRIGDLRRGDAVAVPAAAPVSAAAPAEAAGADTGAAVTCAGPAGYRG